MTRSTGLALAALLLSAGAGCGGKSDAPQLAEVKGTATWQGKPLDNASIVFTPQSGPISVGNTDGEGAFTLTTHGKAGASLGPHRVTIAAYEPDLSKAARTPAPAVPEAEVVTPLKSRIPMNFGDLAKSGLTATVTDDAGKNRFQFDLK